MSMKPVRVGVVGCGNIAPIYIKNASLFPEYIIVAVADIDQDRAVARAREFGVARALKPKDAIKAEDIECILNLTPPAAHAEIAMAAIKRGKHVYNEKPLSIKRKDAAELLERAEKDGLCVGCAPDTFMGAGLQTCRGIVDRGVIGEVIGASGYMMYTGPDAWHPDPEFFFQPGAGPLFDMGPYYITALVNMLGPVARVSGAARATHKTRTIGSGAKKGQKIKVNTPTHVASVLEFGSGAIATLVTSFDAGSHDMPNLEVYGTKGTLRLPDPNGFGGPVKLRLHGKDAWEDVPLKHAYSENSRGVGLADMCRAIRGGGGFRASGAMAAHVLEVMHAALEAAESGERVKVRTKCERPEPMPVGGFGAVSARAARGVRKAARK
jgi:predicted dehydrogenase